MKLEIARGLFLLAALAVTTVAIAAWDQPGPGVLSAVHGEGFCPLPREKVISAVKPDQDFMWLMLGLAQGVKGQH